MPTTYEPIATQTLGSAAATITFSSIPATYTDLRLVLVTQNTTSANLTMQFNSDSGTNYSTATLFGAGASASSERSTNATSLRAGSSAGNTNFRLIEIDVFNYTGSTFKTELTTASLDDNGSGSIRKIVGLWRSTSVINRIDLAYSSGNHAIGTTATLYGIKNA